MPTTLTTPGPSSASQTPTPAPAVTPSTAPSATPTAAPDPDPTLGPMSTPEPSFAPVPAVAGDVLINELYYDALQSGTDASYEWFELLNRTSTALDLTGWGVVDNYGADPLPPLTLPPGGLGVVAASPAFFDEFPSFEGNVAFIADGRIGNGLSNSGDRLRLIDSTGGVIDELSYGDDSSLMSPSCSDVRAGHSLERRLAGLDTDGASDFVENGDPTPGDLWEPPPTQLPTPEPTFAPVKTPSPSPAVLPSPFPSAAAQPVAATASSADEPTPSPGTAIPTHAGASPIPGASPASTASPTPGQAETPVLSPGPPAGPTEVSMWLYAAICISAVLVGSISVAGIRRLRSKG